MKISIAATNPCHLYDMAKELAQAEVLGTYYSGYPQWKLPDSEKLNLRCFSTRTTLVYAMRKFLPENLRPSDSALFGWQDKAFDRWVSQELEPCDFVHGLPGQCRSTFLKARKLGIATVLNHATGPVDQLVERLASEYDRVGLDPSEDAIFDDDYLQQQAEESDLADFHCAGSTLVASQLQASGISEERIWVVPYGVDDSVFPGPGRTTERSHPSDGFRIAFAGQLCLRKGIRFLLEALEEANQASWSLELWGPRMAETSGDLEAYRGVSPLTLGGSVSQSELSETFQKAHVLVLPSLEEGFGLVVPQALACGLPVIVSDSVGAKDLIRHRENGSVVPTADSEALRSEMEWWAENWKPIERERFCWKDPAQRLIHFSRSALSDQP